jgi:hypothetical protein
MRGMTMMAMAGLLASGLAAPVMAQQDRGPYYHDGKRYSTLAQCRAAKKRSEKRATIVGAATAGVGAALLGGNVGETALVAGGGAVVGNAIASRKRC